MEQAVTSGIPPKGLIPSLKPNIYLVTQNTLMNWDSALRDCGLKLSAVLVHHYTTTLSNLRDKIENTQFKINNLISTSGTNDGDKAFLIKAWETELTTIQKEAQELAQLRAQQRAKSRENSTKPAVPTAPAISTTAPATSTQTQKNVSAPDPTKDLVSLLTDLLQQNHWSQTPFKRPNFRGRGFRGRGRGRGNFRGRGRGGRTGY